MTFNIQYFAAAAGYMLRIGRAWARNKTADCCAGIQHHDPVYTAPRGRFLAMLTRMR